MNMKTKNIQNEFSVIQSAMLSHVWLFVAPRPIACWSSLPMGFSRQEYRSGVPLPTLGALLDLGIELLSLRSPALAGGFLTTNATWEFSMSVNKHSETPHITYYSANDIWMSHIL